MEADTETFNNALQRATNTGRPLRHSLRRETLRRQRQIEAGTLRPDLIGNNHVIETPPVPTPVAETPLPVPGINTPQIPSPGIEHPGAPTPTAEKKTDAAPKKSAAKSKSADTKTGTDKTKSTSASEKSGDFDGDDEQLRRMTNNIGRRVKWVAFGKEIEGKLHTVVPIGKTPRDLNIEAGGATPRDHLSYVVEKDGGSMVWPKVKDLSPVEA